MPEFSMLAAAPTKYYFLRDRNQWSQGDPELVAILRLPVIAGGVEEGKVYELENIGDANIDENSASIKYTGNGGGGWNFKWLNGSAAESHCFAMLINGGHVLPKVGNRKFMPLEEADQVDVETMLAMDAVDLFTCSNMKTKKKTGSDELHVDLVFAGRDPLGDDEEK